jgi:diguanylate cyclase (GGDEF)-like protein
MRLAVITNWAYGATVALTLAAGATMLLASNAQEQERSAVAQRYELDQLTSQVGEQEQLLSGHARQYVITGSPADLAGYERELARLVSAEERLRRMRDRGAGLDELAALKDGIAVVDALMDEQQAAVEARRDGNVRTAMQLVFSPQYETELNQAASLFERFRYRLDQRAAVEIANATRTARTWKTVSEGVLAVTALLFLFVLYFVFRKRVLQPVVTLSDVVTRLAAQDFDAVPPKLDQVDEIGDMAQAIRIFRENGLERQRLERERDADRALRDLMGRMTQRLQACDTIDDLVEVVARFAPRIAPDYAGRLYLLDTSRQVLVEACAWLDPAFSAPEFVPTQCWALRRGLPHHASGEQVDVPCPHAMTDKAPEADTLCLPLIAQRETFGLLYLERRRAPFGSASEIYLTLLAENVGLAIANLRLRDALRSLAMVDPLTGLSNRRELDRILALERSRSGRDPRSLSAIMIDVDHFKRFNDEFGHDAGDAVLRAVGDELIRTVRDGAHAFRMGGEEFLVLLPDVGLGEAQARAEAIRTRLKTLRVDHSGKALGAITVSLGVASAPEVCGPQVLAETADAALLRAKSGGRDQVVVAEPRAQSRAA